MPLPQSRARAALPLPILMPFVSNPPWRGAGVRTGVRLAAAGLSGTAVAISAVRQLPRVTAYCAPAGRWGFHIWSSPPEGVPWPPDGPLGVCPRECCSRGHHVWHLSQGHSQRPEHARPAAGVPRSCRGGNAARPVCPERARRPAGPRPVLRRLLLDAGSLSSDASVGQRHVELGLLQQSGPSGAGRWAPW